MALTESNTVQIGTKAPDFQLLNVRTNKHQQLAELAGKKGTVIAFICNHCPFVKHINTELVAVANNYQNKGIQFIAISSNDVENYPEDSPEKMKNVAEKLNYPFPYLYDETQKSAKEYDAACTPDFYLFDDELKLTYHGRFDESRPESGKPVTGKDLIAAMEALLNDGGILKNQQPSMGCNIKWKDDKAIK